jgi:GT2 family glycosyltransferase
VQLLRGAHAGPPAARNRGFHGASGDFVVNLDADDLFYPERLEALGELAAARPDLDILASDAYIVSDGRRLGRRYSDFRVFYTDDQRRRILQENFILAFSAVRRARFLEVGGFDESIIIADDWDFWLRLIVHGARAGCVDQPLGEVTVRAGSLSSRRADSLRYEIRVLEKAQMHAVLEPQEQEALADSIERRQRQFARVELKEALLRGDPTARRRLFAAAFEHGHDVPTRLKSAASALAPGLARRLLERRSARKAR